MPDEIPAIRKMDDRTQKWLQGQKDPNLANAHFYITTRYGQVLPAQVPILQELGMPYRQGRDYAAWYITLSPNQLMALAVEPLIGAIQRIRLENPGTQAPVPQRFRQEGPR